MIEVAKVACACVISLALRDEEIACISTRHTHDIGFSAEALDLLFEYYLNVCHKDCPPRERGAIVHAVTVLSNVEASFSQGFALDEFWHDLGIAFDTGLADQAEDALGEGACGYAVAGDLG